MKAKCVINATGPFTDSIRQMDDSKVKKICMPSAGVHIVLPDYYRSVYSPLLDSSCSGCSEPIDRLSNFVNSPERMGLLDPSTSDGRVIFFLPWQKATIAGTTDKLCEVSHHPSPSEEDIQFILNEIRNYLSPDVEGNPSYRISIPNCCEMPWRTLPMIAHAAAFIQTARVMHTMP